MSYSFLGELRDRHLFLMTLASDKVTNLSLFYQKPTQTEHCLRRASGKPCLVGPPSSCSSLPLCPQARLFWLVTPKGPGFFTFLVALTAPRPSWGATTDCLQAWLSPQMYRLIWLLRCSCLFVCVYCFVWLGVKPRYLDMLDRSCTSKLCLFWESRNTVGSNKKLP